MANADLVASRVRVAHAATLRTSLAELDFNPLPLTNLNQVSPPSITQT